MRKYKLAVFIGRFQPYHLGHHTVVQKALEIADEVLILIGSSGGPRTLRNPFTFVERADMIYNSNINSCSRMEIEQLNDHLYNDDKWIEDIQKIVTTKFPYVENKDITLIGYSKDNTSYYLKLFPQWYSVNCEQKHVLSSTDIRESIWGKDWIPEEQLTPPVYEFLCDFADNNPAFDVLYKEYNFVDNYKSKFAGYPFPPTFVTVDAVVVQSGHILLVKRKGFPGKGLWALPGGFLNQSEKIEDACIRELREETRIKVPAPVLRGNIKDRRVFDDPHRSSRGRTITHAFLIHLPPELELPKVKGNDDAEKAKWFPLSQVQRCLMFEDHYAIIESMVAL